MNEEVVGEERDILRPLPEWWQLDREHAQPVVEVLAKPTRLGLRLEVPVGGRDQSHIDHAGPLVADPFELPLLENTEELGLMFEGDLADLVEEQVPPSASSNRPARCAGA